MNCIKKHKGTQMSHIIIVEPPNYVLQIRHRYKYKYEYSMYTLIQIVLVRVELSYFL